MILRLLRGLLHASGCLAIVGSVVFAEDSRYSEYGVKSAFLFNFFKFIELPNLDPGASISLCVMAPQSVFDELAALSGKVIQGRALEVLRIQPGDSVSECRSIFISSENQRLAKDTLAATARGTLGIGEHAQFLSSGGFINFFVEEGKVRFEIDAEAASKAGIQISSKLLKLGRVRGEP